MQARVKVLWRPRFGKASYVTVLCTVNGQAEQSTVAHSDTDSKKGSCPMCQQTPRRIEWPCYTVTAVTHSWLWLASTECQACTLSWSYLQGVLGLTRSADDSRAMRKLDLLAQACPSALAWQVEC